MSFFPGDDRRRVWFPPAAGHPNGVETMSDRRPEVIERQINTILEGYTLRQESGNLASYRYGVRGVFGIQKEQMLYQIWQLADEGVTIYVTASGDDSS